jgi:polyhydroxybutyrate depolymerase
MSLRAESDGCPDSLSLYSDPITSGPIQERVGSEVVRYRWRSCEADTEWYLIEGGGHTWPGGNPSTGGSYVTQQISATELIWAFFKR